ncbi:heterokaryon incompatibility protein-domain-containing protein [Lophiotrema nucula]|uniref:Heterokaryon incompatibility protein-domain-containing protein n=1 Tax=Lophiotrema nucula TaxID=690887 RepID=A0A6A5ZGR1_9PLEO|nr:heterokaryon incompatibility protein-domain-containing protein [Lophiotrema nucula]
MRQYQYDPLPTEPGSIRLLKLLPNEDTEAPIECCLINYSLARARRTSHQYEALSYCWGSSMDKVNISINGRQLQVTRNLHAALRQFRDTHFDRIMWIDALCIDQDDLDERAKQVQFMTSIYACADRVLVWLGEAADGSQEAIQEIREAAEQNARIIHDDDDEKGPDKHLSPASPCVGHLLKRQWFRRIWILQEIAAARSSLISCGPDEITGLIFSRGVQSMKLPLDELSLLSRQLSGVMFLTKSADSSAQLNARLDLSARLNILPLPNLLDMFHAQEATDQRDKVYALLGMSIQGIVLAPNYRRDWQSLFHTLIANILGPGAGIKTWNGKEVALIRANVRIIARVDTVRTTPNRGQVLECRSTPLKPVILQTLSAKQAQQITWKASFQLHSPAKRIQKDDFICLLEGYDLPIVVRRQEEHLSILVISLDPPKSLAFAVEDRDWKKAPSGPPLSWSQFRNAITEYRKNTLLTWDWSNVNSEFFKPTNLQSLETDVQEKLVSAEDLFNMLRVLEDMDMRLHEWPRRDALTPNQRRLLEEEQQLSEYRRLIFFGEVARVYHFDDYIVLKKLLVQQLDLAGHSFTSYLNIEDPEVYQEVIGAVEHSWFDIRQLLKEGIDAPARVLYTLKDQCHPSVKLMTDTLALLCYDFPVSRTVQLLFDVIRSNPAGRCNVLTSLCWRKLDDDLTYWLVDVMTELFDKASLNREIRWDLLTITDASELTGELFFNRNLNAIMEELKDPCFCRYAARDEEKYPYLASHYKRFQLDSLRPWTDIAQVLHCSSTSRDGDDENFAQGIAKRGGAFSLEHGIGDEMLRVVCEFGLKRTVEALLATGQVDPTSQDEWGHDALYLAAGNKERGKAICKILLGSAATFSVEAVSAARERSNIDRYIKMFLTSVVEASIAREREETKGRKATGSPRRKRKRYELETLK